MAALDEYLDALTDHPDRDKIIAEAMEATKDMLWVPNPGPQTDAYFTEADELLYGGEAGGGKSDLIIGLSLTAHSRSLVLRRTNKEADKLPDRYEQVIGSRSGYNSQKGTWRIGGRIIDIGGVQLENDKQKRKGIPHDLKCVASGTQVLMSGNRYQRIETIEVGDYVMTLEGPRQVLKAFKVTDRDCVRVEVNGVSQVQSANHALLAQNGWVSHDTSCDFYSEHQAASGPIQFRALCIGWQDVLHRLWSSLPVLQTTYRWVRSIAGLRSVARAVRCFADRPDLHACTAQQGQGTYSAEFDDEHLGAWRQQGYRHARQERQQQNQRSTMHESAQHLPGRDGVDAHGTSLPADLMGRCLNGTRPHGERIPESSDHRAQRAAYRSYPLLLADAGQHSPTDLQTDGQGITQRRIHHTQLYAHPYTMETRQSQIFLRESPCHSFPVERQPLHDLEIEEVNHFITYGGIVNKNCFDELVDFTESQYLFINTWNRTTQPGQRCRIVATTNPPTTPEGMWVVKRWAAWLDPKHPNPAKDGELRWYTTINGTDTEVDGPGPHMVEGRQIMAKSRTFIRSKLSDNPDLTRTDDYQRTLDALPEELRAAYAEGRFDVGLKDQPFQAIPTEWIRAAQDRWTDRAPDGVPQCAIGVDCSGGGNDPMILAIRNDGWFAPMIEIPAKDIPPERMGKHSAGIIVSYRQNNSTVIVDMGGGYGGPTYEQLHENNVEAVPYKGAEKSVRRTKDGLLGFTNKRTEIIWKLRESLDPAQPGGSPIMLPPDPQLLADLAAPTFRTVPAGIQIESKEDVCKRLGRSTDKGDAVCMAWYAGPTYVTDGQAWAEGKGSGRRARPQVIMGRRK